MAPSHDAFLALDLNGNSTIDSGAELFDNHTLLPDASKASNGWAALAQYDHNQDGVIDKLDPIFKQLLIWKDGNGNGVSQAEELQSLEQLKIVRIDLRASMGLAGAIALPGSGGCAGAASKPSVLVIGAGVLGLPTTHSTAISQIGMGCAQQAVPEVRHRLLGGWHRCEARHQLD